MMMNGNVGSEACMWGMALGGILLLVLLALAGAALIKYLFFR